MEAVKHVTRADGRQRVVDTLIVDSVEDADFQREYKNVMEDDMNNHDRDDDDSEGDNDVSE